VINELTASDSCSSKNRNYKKDGSVVVCEWINVRYCNASGETIGYLTFCQDITELEEKKSLLEEIKHYFSTFFDSIPIPVIYLNNNLIIKNSNSTFNKIFQTNSNKLSNINLTELDSNSQTTKHNLHQQLINFINSDELTLVTDTTLLISPNNVREYEVFVYKQLDKTINSWNFRIFL
jgi:PAS domain-containing protein